MLRAVAKGYEMAVTEADPNDSWDRPNTQFNLEEVYVTLADEGARNYGMFDENFEVEAGPGDIVHVVYVRYSTGDTFGNDDGRVTFMDIFPAADEVKAHKLRAAIETCTGYGLTFEGKDYYIPFNGYFESLEGVEVTSLVVRK
jgi:hypothetical protein